MLVDLPSIFIIILLNTIIFCMIFYILMILTVKSVKKNINILMSNYNCFNFKVAYDIMVLDKAQTATNILQIERRNEILQIIVHCQQSIDCGSIVENIKKINKEDGDF